MTLVMEDLGTCLIFSTDSKELFEEWYRNEALNPDDYNFALCHLDRFKNDGLTFREVADRINLLTEKAGEISDDTHIKPDTLAFILRHLHRRFENHPDKEALCVLFRTKGKEMAPLGNVPVSYLVASSRDEVNSQKKREEGEAKAKEELRAKEVKEKEEEEKKKKRKAEEEHLKKKREEEKPQDRRKRADLFAKRFENLFTSKSRSPLGMPDAKPNDDTDNDTH